MIDLFQYIHFIWHFALRKLPLICDSRLLSYLGCFIQNHVGVLQRLGMLACQVIHRQNVELETAAIFFLP